MADDGSSVLFNLAELMELEHERVRAEELAARRERERAEREAREAEERLLREAQAERERVAALERAEVEAEREREARALAEREQRALRTRLELEMRERAAARDAEREHARALAEVEAAARPRRAPQILVAVLLGGVVALGGGYLGVLRPVLAEAHARDASARGTLERELSDLRRLREQLRTERLKRESQLRAAASTPAPPQVAAQAPSAAEGSARPSRPVRREVTRRPSRPVTGRTADDPLGDLSFEGDDPLKGLVEPVTGKRLRRR